ncbi:Uncharacterized protein APZ42_010777, partial [Daphnia magna]
MANYDGTSSSVPKVVNVPGMRFNEQKFQGKYPMIGVPCGSVAASLSFHLVSTNQIGLCGEQVELVHMVPEHLVDTDF